MQLLANPLPLSIVQTLNLRIRVISFSHFIQSSANRLSRCHPTNGSISATLLGSFELVDRNAVYSRLSRSDKVSCFIERLHNETVLFD